MLDGIGKGGVVVAAGDVFCHGFDLLLGVCRGNGDAHTLQQSDVVEVIADEGVTSDNFNEPVVPGTQADGYHLNSKYGDYTAALTWYCHYSGDDANVMSGYTGDLTEREFQAIAQAVNRAIAYPYIYQGSTYKD